MNEPRFIVPVTHPVRGSVRPPGSKSITNRALVCAALANGSTRLVGALASEDTRLMIDALRTLGFVICIDEDTNTLVVEGGGGSIPADRADLFVGNSGTTIRFLAAMVATGCGRFRLDGIERMRERPIGDLLVALSQLGVVAKSEFANDCPPVIIEANNQFHGVAHVGGDISSQFLSGLLMAAPCASAPVTIHVDGELVSRPYVAMTRDVMRAFGVTVDHSDAFDRFEIRTDHKYRGVRFEIEPDASAASYFWAAAAITGGEVSVEGLSKMSLQGDVAFCECLRRMGCEVEYSINATTVRGGPICGIDADMNSISDTVQTLAVVALFAKGATTIRNVAHIRHKETDRIAAVAAELRQLGAQVEERDDGMVIHPPQRRHAAGAEISTYNDHRMAMSFALAGLAMPDVAILDPDCVQKTYPSYFNDLSRIARE